MMTEHDYKRFRDASIEATENMYRQMAKDAEKRGKTEGKIEGKDEEKVATAKRLYNANTSIDVIKTATGLSERQIKRICL